MISEYLSKSERLALMKCGALACAARLDAEQGPLPEVKSAQDASTAKNLTDAMKSLLLVTALGAGIPFGVFAHAMGRRIAGKNLREEELKAKIDLYRNAADELAGGLRSAG